MIFFNHLSKSVLLLWILFVVYCNLRYTFVFIILSCLFLATLCEWADLMTLMCVMFPCFPNGVLGKVWYSKICLKRLLSNRPSQQYCKMLLGEHTTILSTFIKLPFVIKIFVLCIIEWPLNTNFTVLDCIDS